MITLEQVEECALAGDVDRGYEAFLWMLAEADPSISARDASRMVGALSTLLCRGPLSPPAFDGLVGRGQEVRHVFDCSGFAGPSHLVSLLATPSPDGNDNLSSVDQFEKLLCLASVKHYPPGLLGMIPKLHPQTVLKLSLHLISDPDLERLASLRDFIDGLSGLFARMDVTDGLVPAFGPAFSSAARLDSTATAQTALQEALAGWRSKKGYLDLEIIPCDGPEIIVSAEGVGTPNPDAVVLGPHAEDGLETIPVPARVRDFGRLLEAIRRLRPRSVLFAGRQTTWWILLLSQLRLASQQSSRDIDLRTEATPFCPPER